MRLTAKLTAIPQPMETWRKHTAWVCGVLFIHDFQAGNHDEVGYGEGVRISSDTPRIVVLSKTNNETSI